MNSSRSSRRKPRINLQSEAYTLSTAKSYLGRLIDKASRGEPVYILRGLDRFQLQQVPSIDPIPIRPPGYFENCYTRAEIQELNSLARVSVIRPPKDLE